MTKTLRRSIPILVVASLAACVPTTEAGAPGDGAPNPVERSLHAVNADGHTMAVWEKAPADPIAVLLLVHGRTWSTVPDFDLQAPGEELSLMDGLVSMGIATYGVDLRGYGGTARDESGWNTPSVAASDVAHVLRWIRERHPSAPVHLFGWSLGSMVSQLTAQRDPRLVDRLVLFGYPYRPGVRAPVQEPEGAPPMAPTTADAAASDFITPGSISQSAIDEYVRAALEADPVRTDWTRGHEWNELDPASVTVPTLVLQGEHDPLAPAEAQAALFQDLGTADKAWVVVPGGDHAAFLEAPRAYFLSALQSFLLGGSS